MHTAVRGALLARHWIAQLSSRTLDPARELQRPGFLQPRRRRHQVPHGVVQHHQRVLQPVSVRVRVLAIFNHHHASGQDQSNARPYLGTHILNWKDDQQDSTG